MGDSMRKMKLAAVQSSSVFLNREASIEKACRLIREAGANGADLVALPEGFIPTHPVWFHFLASTSIKGLELSRELFNNSVEIPSAATDALCQACREAGTIAVVGLCEKLPNKRGNMYNTQLFIDQNGKILGKHQKIMPTLGERIVHTGGHGNTMKAFPTSFGNISGLLCGENSNPLAAFALAAMYPVVHIAAWPSHFCHGVWMQDSITAASTGLAYMLKGFVINSVGVVTDEHIDIYAVTDEDRKYLEKARDTGASSIVGPMGTIIAGPLPAGEGILYANVDLNNLVIPKILTDYAGDYNRFDVFSLNVNVDTPKSVRHIRSMPVSDDIEFVSGKFMEIEEESALNLLEDRPYFLEDRPRSQKNKPDK
ncbi:MAG: carbon-nitrogen hydrolase family protein [Deltaproteobacteria bacterium]|nr:carbon-nitrogen hydrolase family protein [Deltaproteobacteria bacterium]